jgi:hypothetical protein
VGIRHAAREKGCVLLAADWSKQLFDVAQMRTIRYPLADGEVGEAAAQAIRAAIAPKIEALAKGGSPVFESIKGYPSEVDEADMADLESTVLFVQDPDTKNRLRTVLETLKTAVA